MSTLKVDTLQTTGGAGLYPARAWLNYNQVVVGITNSANVSSVTDDSLGVYTVSFTNAFSAATYCAGMVGWRRVSEGQLDTSLMMGTSPRQQPVLQCIRLTEALVRLLTSMSIEYLGPCKETL